MLLGKRQRPPIKRTTSLSEITFYLNGESEPSDQHTRDHRHHQNRNHGFVDQRFLAMVSSRGNHRRHSADSETGHFLRLCSLCKRRLVPGRDIYMYRGDSAFCSLECRHQQMIQDEWKEKCGLTSKKVEAASANSATAGGGGGDSANGEKVAAAV